MGVKETPITADEDEGEGDNGSGEEAPEEQETKEETPPEEAKPKRKAKPKAAKKVEEKPKKKAEEKPKKKPEEKPEMPEEMPKPAKKAKKETVDLKTKTACSICKSGPISTDALLYTHSCKKEALAKRKTAPLYDEVAAQPAQGTAVKMPWQSGEAKATPRHDSELPNPEAPPPPSYREILARQQQEMRRQKAARIVNPIRAHFFGYA